MLDIRGVMRGSCRNCDECTEFVISKEGAECAYCGCCPVKHVRLDPHPVPECSTVNVDVRGEFNILIPCLPTFSTSLERALQSGNMSTMWTTLIRESSSFFLDNPHVITRDAYTYIGQKMYEKYPCIDHKRGPLPWSHFTSCLSMRLRKDRMQLKALNASIQVQEKEFDQMGRSEEAGSLTVALPKKNVRHIWYQVRARSSPTLELQIPDLPTFSPGLERVLQSGTISRMWSNLIVESSRFFLDNPHVTSKRAYSYIGQKMYEKYPCIGKGGKYPWSRFVSSLSSRIRKDRMCLKAGQFIGFDGNAEATSSHPVERASENFRLSRSSIHSDSSSIELLIPSMPTFSDGLERALRSGNIAHMWSALIAESSNFFLDNPHVSSKKAYLYIGQKMYEKYPCIENESGTMPWSYFTSCLSSRLRKSRMQLKALNTASEGREAEQMNVVGTSTSLQVKKEKEDEIMSCPTLPVPLSPSPFVEVVVKLEEGTSFNDFPQYPNFHEGSYVSQVKKSSQNFSPKENHTYS